MSAKSHLVRSAKTKLDKVEIKLRREGLAVPLVHHDLAVLAHVGPVPVGGSGEELEGTVALDVADLDLVLSKGEAFPVGPGGLPPGLDDVGASRVS